MTDVKKKKNVYTEYQRAPLDRDFRLVACL